MNDLLLSSSAGSALGHLVIRVGTERFALPLDTVETALDAPDVTEVPGLSSRWRGLLVWQGRRLPVACPGEALGVAPRWPYAAVLVLTGTPVLAVGVDDVEDVVHLPVGAARPVAGVRDPHQVLVGVVRHGGALVSVIDVPALAGACGQPQGATFA
jgi:chemotaxis signal transduction protein